MIAAKIAQKSPYEIEVEEGKRYFWCACGHSSKQPFCDGSHSSTEFKPVVYRATETKKLYFLRLQTIRSRPTL